MERIDMHININGLKLEGASLERLNELIESYQKGFESGLTWRESSKYDPVVYTCKTHTDNKPDWMKCICKYSKKNWDAWMKGFYEGAKKNPNLSADHKAINDPFWKDSFWRLEFGKHEIKNS